MFLHFTKITNYYDNTPYYSIIPIRKGILTP